MGATGHLSARQGTKVKVHLRNGTNFIAKFKQRHSKTVEFDDGLRVATNQISTISYFKPTQTKQTKEEKRYEHKKLDKRYDY